MSKKILVAVFCYTLLAFWWFWGNSETAIWPWSLVAHFTEIAFYFNLLWIFGFLIAQRWSMVIISIIVGVTMFVPMQAVLEETESIYEGNLLVWNLFYQNRNYDALRPLLREGCPEVVLLLEADKSWEPVLVEEGYRVLERFDEGKSLKAVIAARPSVEIEQCELVEIGGYPVFRLFYQGGTVYGIRPYPEVNKELARKQAYFYQQLAKIYDKHRLEGSPFLIVGDFNATPWHHNVKKNFPDAKFYKGWSWYSRVKLGLSLDHAIGWPDPQRTLDNRFDRGSDHNPQWVRWLPEQHPKVIF